MGDAHKIVPTAQGRYDFVFSDADKDWYIRYFDAMYPNLTDNACFTAHNVEESRFGFTRGWVRQGLSKTRPRDTRHGDIYSSRQRPGVAITCKKTAEVAFQIRRLREAKGWSQKGFGQEDRLQSAGGIRRGASRLQTALAAATSLHRRCLRHRRSGRSGATQPRLASKMLELMELELEAGNQSVEHVQKRPIPPARQLLAPYLRRRSSVAELFSLISQQPKPP
jgi:hypothetical protein